MQFEKVDKLIDESKKLMDYTMSMKNVTNYENEETFDSGNFSRILQSAREEVKAKKQISDSDRQSIEKIVKIHFSKPEKTIKEVFEEYTEELTPEEAKRFFENLKKIIN